MKDTYLALGIFTLTNIYVLFTLRKRFEFNEKLLQIALAKIHNLENNTLND